MQTYAVVVGALSAVTCVLYFIPFVLRIAGIFAAVWDLILFILWITLFGVFGKVSQLTASANDARRFPEETFTKLTHTV